MVPKVRRRAVDVQYNAWQESPTCRRARGKADASWTAQMWNERRNVVYIFGAIALLILITPFMVKRMAPDAWARLLTIAMPCLLVAGLATYASIEMQRLHERLTTTAEPCRGDGQGASLDVEGLAKERLRVIHDFRSRVGTAK